MVDERDKEKQEMDGILGNLTEGTEVVEDDLQDGSLKEDPDKEDGSDQQTEPGKKDQREAGTKIRARRRRTQRRTGCASLYRVKGSIGFRHGVEGVI